MEVTADDSDNYTNILTKLFLGEMAFKRELNQVADNLYKFIFGWGDWYCSSENALFAHCKSALKSFRCGTRCCTHDTYSPSCVAIRSWLHGALVDHTIFLLPYG